MTTFSAEEHTRLERWLQDLEARHLADLRFSDVTRALRALSAGYVERRETLTARSPFEGAGKRAAYALFYAPLHFLTVRAIVKSLPDARDPVALLADWGCGTGAAGAAWATTTELPPPRVSAIDVHPWALSEAARTYEVFGLAADVRRGALHRARLPSSTDALIAGWVLNELSDQARNSLLPRVLEVAKRGVRVLIVEPIAARMTRWWADWTTAFQSVGGRADQWRFPIELPPLLRRLDKAAGLRHDEITARSLWLRR